MGLHGYEGHKLRGGRLDPLAKGPSAGAGGGAGAWVWLEAMAAHVGSSHPVAAKVRAASAAAWSAGDA